MKIANKIILILLILLSLSTGLFKILQQPADIELFKEIGIGEFGTTLLGVTQFVGGILLIFPVTRKHGAVIMTVTFVLASIAVFANGMFLFGVFSILFILMAIFIFIKSTEREIVSAGE